MKWLVSSIASSIFHKLTLTILPKHSLSPICLKQRNKRPSLTHNKKTPHKQGLSFMSEN